MDDMTAFDRLLASEVLREAGPTQPVNDAAVYAATQAVAESPQWRFQSMFGATRFVLAGVIVALFGGFLLAGVLTQPRGEQVPAVGASASAQSLATETTAPSRTPTEGEPGLLPGVDLQVRDVAPGVYRVLGDGVRDLRDNVGDVAVTSDGSVWIERHDEDGRNSRVIRLGDPGVAFRIDQGPTFLETLPGGSVMAFTSSCCGDAGEVVRIYVGDAWVDRRDEAAQACSGRTGSATASLDLGPVGLLTPGGACWISIPAEPKVFGPDGVRIPQGTLGEQYPGVALLRVDSDGTEIAYTYDDIGLGPDEAITEHLALAQDGTLWAAYTRGLVAFDGETWRVVPFDGDTIDPWGVSVGLDGAAYLALHGSAGNLGGGVGIHRWDGHAWTERGSLFWPGDPVFGRFRIDADGIVWLGVLDVSSDPPRHLELPGQLTGAGSRYTSNFAPGANGNLWVTVHEQRDEAEDVSRGLFVITPEAMASGA